MRRETLVPDSFHHIILRGARGMDILLDEQDWWEVNFLLYHLNDSYVHSQWKRDITNKKEGIFSRPKHWPARDLLVHIGAYCLHANHIHLLVYEFQEGGVSSFMRRLPKVLTHRFNKKYGGSGSIFQGPYKLRTVGSDADLRNLALYVMAKNVMERFPKKGIVGALKEPEIAWGWALKDNFSSFPEYGGKRQSPIIEKSSFCTLWSDPKYFKKEVFEYLIMCVSKQNEKNKNERRYK